MGRKRSLIRSRSRADLTPTSGWVFARIMLRIIPNLTSPDIEIAQHEAGHAVVASILGISNAISHFITILPDSSGLFRGRASLDIRHATIEQYGIVAMAGFVAQRHGYLLRNPNTDDSDMNLAKIWMQSLGDHEDAKAYGGQPKDFDKYKDAASDLIEGNWNLIESVADDLVAQKIVFLEEFEIIMESTSLNKNPRLVLEPYRRHRRYVEDPSNSFLVHFRQQYPKVPWPESYGDFVDREKREDETLASFYTRMMNMEKKLA